MSNVKKSIVLTVILSLLLSIFVSAETVIPFEGEGTQESPYFIGTAEEMYRFAEIVNSGYSFDGEYLKLTDDLLLFDAKTSTAELKTTWIPIGKDFDCSFSGSFDGDGHEIKGVYIYSDKGIQGLFGCIRDGEIKNLTLSESVISGNGHYVAGIVACQYSEDEEDHNKGIISGCVNNAVVINKSMHTGGVVASGIRVVDCVNNGNVTGSDIYVGGVAVGACRIENCVNNGDVTGTENVAGVCYTTYCERTHNYERGVFGCTNNGTVKGEKECFGIVSLDNSVIHGDALITDCSNYGNVYSSELPYSILGDMNYDSRITAADARRILRCSAKLDSEWNFYDTVRFGDFDYDGKLTAKDARKCLRYAAQVDDYFKDFGVNIK